MPLLTGYWRGLNNAHPKKRHKKSRQTILAAFVSNSVQAVVILPALSVLFYNHRGLQQKQ